MTEKILQALRQGAVPIYHGALNVKELLPHPNAAVLTEDFESVQAAMEYANKVRPVVKIHRFFALPPFSSFLRTASFFFTRLPCAPKRCPLPVPATPGPNRTQRQDTSGVGVSSTTTPTPRIQARKLTNALPSRSTTTSSSG